MAGFLYFAPHVETGAVAAGGKFNANVLFHFDRDGALVDLVEHARDGMVNGVKKGPGGNPGTILVPLSPGIDTDKVQAIYKPDQQTWLPILEGQYWIGFWNDKPPVAPELQRRKVFPGYTVTDGNGQQWQIPVARSGDGVTCTLPTYHHFDPATLELKRNLRPEYSRLWEIAGEVFDFFTGQWPEGKEQPSASAQIMWAVAALAVNYRIGRAEIAALTAAERNPLDNDTVGNVLISLCDKAVFDETLKNLPAGIAPAVPASTSSTNTAPAAEHAMPSAAAN